MEKIYNRGTSGGGSTRDVAKLEEHWDMLGIQKKEADRVQFSALLRSARILGKALSGYNRIPTKRQENQQRK